MECENEEQPLGERGWMKTSKRSYLIKLACKNIHIVANILVLI